MKEPTRAQINKVLYDPPVKNIPFPCGAMIDQAFVMYINYKADKEGSQAALARKLNVSRFIVSKAARGYLYPQIGYALGYKPKTHWDGTSAYRIWVKI